MGSMGMREILEEIRAIGFRGLHFGQGQDSGRRSTVGCIRVWTAVARFTGES